MKDLVCVNLAHQRIYEEAVPGCGGYNSSSETTFHKNNEEWRTASKDMQRFIMMTNLAQHN